MKDYLIILTIFLYISFVFAQEYEIECTGETETCENGKLEDYEYRFMADMFSWSLPEWPIHLERFKGKKNLNFLEIGTHEGRSALWLLDNILTHPSSRITCVDNYCDNYSSNPIHLENFNYNMRKHRRKVTLHKKDSYSTLITLNANNKKFDLAYIDGCHQTLCVLQDTVLAFPLVKVGGIIIFDDYDWPSKGGDKINNPGPAIDSFLQIYKDYINILHKDYQVIVQKLKDFK
jgi:predicted O-methyltransferase YrrM